MRAKPNFHPAEPSDEQLWSWVDREAPELETYLASDPLAHARVEEIRHAIGRFEAADPVVLHPESIGEYVIEGLLGRGGMGLVYDARQSSPKRNVALKVMPQEYALDKRWLRRFQREADAQARLSHPGIATIYGVGRGQDGRPYIAMERIEGRALGEFLDTQNPSVRERLQLAREICEAVGHAHLEGVVHRDIKPANILVRPSGKPVVVDFGLARLVDEQLSQGSLASQTGSLLGTLPYMSPEQVAGHSELDARSDVYSLGVVLYELFVGHMPYDLKGLSLVAAARRIQEAPPKRRGRIRRKLRGDLFVVIFKALSKEPARRYENADALAEDLRRCMEGRPVEAVPVSWAWRAFSALRRHWASAGLLFAGGLVALLLILPTQLPFPLISSWWSEGAPFEDVRWMGDSPEVLVDGEWFSLVAIDDLRSGYIVGFCQQTGGTRWRKRFSEDLVQVLNRLGTFGVGGVDLTLRSLEDGQVTLRGDVPLDRESRRQILRRRFAWPWPSVAFRSQGTPVQYQGKRWIVRSVDGVPVEQFRPNITYDSYCDRMGRSPGDTVSFVLEGLDDGVLQSFENIPRVQFATFDQ